MPSETPKSEPTIEEIKAAVRATRGGWKSDKIADAAFLRLWASLPQDARDAALKLVRTPPPAIAAEPGDPQT